MQSKNNYASIFRKLQELLGAKNVYPTLPLQDVKYPFATFYKEDIEINALKLSSISMCNYTFDIWSKDKKELKEITNKINQYLLFLGAKKINIRFLEDDSTNEIIQRVNFEFQIR